jgi:hypothetical protein
MRITTPTLAAAIKSGIDGNEMHRVFSPNSDDGAAV